MGGSATTPATMHPSSQNLLSTVAAILGISVSALTSEFKLTLHGLKDGGVGVSFRSSPGDPTPSVETVLQPASFVIPASGAENANIASGTATLASSTIDVTVSGGVPSGATVYATVTTPAGTVKQLSAVRKDANTITVSSTGSGFGALLDSAGSQGTCSSSTVNVALANVVGDVLAVKEVSTGGTAADHFSVVRVDNSNVKIQAHTSAGALVAGNTSVVKAYNLGQAAHETSIVRWVVVRP